ncbi:MAG TPA: VWA domain-containing protein, partial [Pirellulales bacterium]|nr:VWA domain-containing protein [Pirellulales bacterium]
MLFTNRRAWIFGCIASCVALSQVARGADPASPLADTSLLADTFTSPQGTTLYAIAVTPQGKKPAIGPTDVVVLFDTSASQTGDYRDKAFETLDVLLANLQPDSRVRLAAVDVQPTELNTSFAAPGSDELKSAVEQLRGRTPLGSTDMDAALAWSAGAFGDDSNDRSRAVVYIGDGMSAAQVMPSARLQELTGALVNRRVAVTSFGIGPRIDGMLLGALASDTGGVLALDNDDLNARQVGMFLVTAATGAVAWPSEMEADESLGITYPRRIAPLRFDRETILLGQSPQPPSGQLRVTATIADASVAMQWSVSSKASDVENSYLDELVRSAERDDAVSLPLVGTAGLAELRNSINVRAQGLARLGQQAVATGNNEQAQQLAAEALRLDAGNADAAAVDAAAKHAPAGGRELKLVNFQNANDAPPDNAAEPLPATGREAAPDEGNFLNEVNEQRAVLAGRLQADVQATINQARSLMPTNPDAAANILKLALEGVTVAPELSDDIRLQLVDQLQSALREASRQAQIKAERDLREAAIAAEAEQRAQMTRELFDAQNRKSQLVERFNTLMDERRYADAEAVADTVRQDEPAVPVVMSGTQLTARQTKFTTDAQYMNLAD